MKPQFTISGNEIGSLLGLNRYSTPMDFYMKKLGLIEPEPENEPMKWGTAAEHVVARRYARETGAILYPHTDQGYDYHNKLVHPQYPWWVGTPDRAITDKTKPVGLLEIKIVGERTAHQWGDAPDGEVPEQYLCQICWYMPLLGVEWADLAVQIGNRDYRVYRINRDRELEDQLRDAALSFINDHLIPQIPPDIDGSESSKRYLNYRYPKDTEPLLEPTDEDILMLIQAYRGSRENQKNYEELTQEFENRIKAIIGEAAGLQGIFGKILWKKNRDSQTLDYKAMAEAYPDIAAKFMKPKPGARVFRTYFKGD